MNKPKLIFSLDAWNTLICLRDITDNEVGGFALTRPNNPLYVTDIRLIKQKVSAMTVKLDDDSLGKYVEDMFRYNNIAPINCQRIWIHTHPGNSAAPSYTDEENFNRIFFKDNPATWAIMFILAKGGQTYARLRLTTPFACELEIDHSIDYPLTINKEEITNEYHNLVTVEKFEQNWKNYNHQFKHLPNQHSIYHQLFLDDDKVYRNNIHQLEFDDDLYEKDIEFFKGNTNQKESLLDIPMETRWATQEEIDKLDDWWNLREELEDIDDRDEVIYILDDLGISLDDAVRYVCSYDENGDMLVAVRSYNESGFETT